MDVSTEFAALVRRANVEPALRGRVLWFPEEVCDEFGLTGAEAEAVIAGDVSGLCMDAGLAPLADAVFNTHDLHAGE